MIEQFNCNAVERETLRNAFNLHGLPLGTDPEKTQNHMLISYDELRGSYTPIINNNGRNNVQLAKQVANFPDTAVKYVTLQAIPKRYQP